MIDVELWEDTQSGCMSIAGGSGHSLWGSYVQGDWVGGELADFHHLWSGEEILNPVTKWSVKAEVWEFDS